MQTKSLCSATKFAASNCVAPIKTSVAQTKQMGSLSIIQLPFSKFRLTRKQGHETTGCHGERDSRTKVCPRLTAIQLPGNIQILKTMLQTHHPTNYAIRAFHFQNPMPKISQNKQERKTNQEVIKYSKTIKKFIKLQPRFGGVKTIGTSTDFKPKTPRKQPKNRIIRTNRITGTTFVIKVMAQLK